MIHCVVVDDEPLAREGIIEYIGEVEFLKLSGTCENPVKLSRFLESNQVDLIFLDIQMPKMNGIDFLKMIQQPPMVILTTAYPNYALEGFQLGVLDYLLKPISFERFFQSVNKARDYQKFIEFTSGDTAQKTTFTETYFFIRCGRVYEKIIFDDVLYLESLQNYVNIFTTKGKYMTLITMKNLEQNFDPAAFMRVHKSFVVSIGKIERIEGNEIIIGSSRIQFSRTYRDQVLDRVISRRLLD
jgi:two-component system LytT family response regulator